jgi:signal transduction histidine kinase
MHTLLTLAIGGDLEIIGSRLRARQIAALCGFSNQDQIRIATTVSELARTSFNYAPGGTIRFLLRALHGRWALLIEIEMAWRDRHQTERAIVEAKNELIGSDGVVAARRFMDECDITTDQRGLFIVLHQFFDIQTSKNTPEDIVTAISHLEKLPSNIALSEANRQNVDLSQALLALEAKQIELVEISSQLERTNREVEGLNALLRDKAAALLSASRSKDEFLSTLSHELRGPLSASGMAAGLLEASPHNAEQTTKLSQLITRQVKHMSRLVEDLLDVSRVSRGLVSMHAQPVDISTVITAAVEQLSHAISIKGHAVEVDLPARPCMILGDRTRLVQVLSNLLGNAVRYTPNGGDIVIKAQIENDEVVVEISDNGIGIAESLMPHLFDLYTQAELSTDGKNSGLGLGLALVKSLVELHHGRVTAYSAGIGQGSSFELRFKLMVVCLTD